MWLGDDLLQNSFPRLLLNSENKGDGIGSYGKQVNGEWVRCRDFKNCIIKFLVLYS